MTGREGNAARIEVADAIADLAELSSNDPAARHAVHAIRLTRLTLESFWLDAPRSDDANE